MAISKLVSVNMLAEQMILQCVTLEKSKKFGKNNFSASINHMLQQTITILLLQKDNK